MADIEALGIRIDGVDNIDRAKASLSGFARAADDAGKSAERLGPSAKKAGDDAVGANTRAAQSAERLNKSYGGLNNTLANTARQMLTIAGIGFGTAALVRYVDAWSDLQSTVGAATKDMDGAAGMMRRLVDIANASYSSLDQTVTVYNRNVSVLRELGRSSQEAADFTESLNNMLVITATRGQRAASVQDALSKAMAVGRLQADGLETVLANGGRVAEALAEALGTNVNGLRAMASEGKITASVISGALINSLEDVRKEAELMPATISDGFTRINNNLLEFIGRLDQASGASSAIAELLLGFADGIRTAGDYLIRFGTLVAPAFNVLTSALASVAQYADIAVAAIAGFYAPAVLGGIALLTRALAVGLVGALRAVAVAMMANPIGAVTAILVGAGYAAYKFRDQLSNIFGIDIPKLSRDAGNSIAEWLVKAATIVGFEYENLKDSVSAAFVGMVNASITAIGALVRASTVGIDFLINQYNRIPGVDSIQTLGDRFSPDLVPNPAADRLRAAIAERDNLLRSLEGRDYVGEITDKLRSALSALTPVVENDAAAHEARATALGATTAASGKAADAAKDMGKALRDEWLTSLDDQIEALHEQNFELQDQVAHYGLAESEVMRLAAAQAEEAASSLNAAKAKAVLNGATAEAIAQYDEEITKLRDLANARRMVSGNMAAVEAIRAQEDVAREWARTAEGIEKDLTDALMRGFESGSDFGKNLRDTLNNYFRTLVIRPLIAPIMQQVSGGITNMLGGGGSGGGLPPGAGNLFSTAGNFLTNASLTTGASVGSIGLANMVGAAGGDAIGALIGANAGWTVGSGALGAAGTVMSAIGAAAPYIGIGLMAYSMLKDAFDGETRFGAGYMVDPATGRASRTGGPSGGDSSAASTITAIEGVWSATEQLASRLGGSLAGLSYGAGSELSPEKGNSFVWSSWGRTPEEVSHITGMRALGGVTDGGVVAQEFAIELQRSIIRGLQMSEVDEHWREWIDQFDVSALDEAGVQSIMATIEALVQLREVATNMGMESLANASAKAQANIIQLSGGIDGFTTNLAAYYQAFYSEAERTANLQATLTKTMQDLGYELPETHAAFRALVEAQDLSTEAGQRAYATLIGLSGAFDQLVTSLDGLGGAVSDVFGAQLEVVRSLAAETNRLLGARNRAGTVLGQIDRAMGRADGFSAQRQAELWAAMSTASYEQQIELAQELTNIVLQRYQDEIASAEQLRDLGRSLREYVQSLTIGELSPLTLGEKLAEAGADYATTLAKAQAGDTNAMGRLQGAADAYLRLARDYYASSDEYTRIFGYVTGSLDTLGIQAMSDAERQLGVSEETLNELTELRGVAQRAFNALDSQYQSSLSLLQAETAILADIGADTGRLHDIAGLLAALPAELAGRLQGILTGAAGGVVGGWYQDAGFNDQAGQDYWTDQLQKLPQDQVRQNYLESLVTSWYKDHLGWSPDGASVEYWADIAQQMGASEAYKHWAHSAGLPGYANGGFASGMAIVGERGPEIVDFTNSPGRVYTNSQLSSAMSMGQGAGEEVRMLRRELAEQSKMLAMVIAQSSQANAERVSGAVENTASRSTWDNEQRRYATTS